MVASVLDEQRIKDGELFIRALDRAGLGVNAALWFLFPDTEKWKLVISLPNLEAEGPRRAYQEVQKAVSEAGDAGSISFTDVTIAPPKWGILNLLRSALSKTGPEFKPIRFTGNVVNGQYIADALIYRLN